MDHQERILLFLTVSVVILSSSFAANCQLGYDERVFAVYNDKISCESAGHCWDDDVTSEIPSCYYDDSCNDGHFRGSLGQCIPCHCKVQCHKKTGVCMSGCVDGYTGDNCQTKQAAPPDQPDEMEIVAAVVVIIVMIVIFSIATAYVVRGRRCPAWNKDPNPATRMTTQHETNPYERRRRPEDLYWSNENTPRTQLRNINHGTPRQSPRPPVAAAADEFQRNHMTSSTDEHPSTSNEVAVVASTEIDSTHDTSRYERSNQSVDKPALLNDEQGTNGDDDELPQVDDEVVPSAMPQRPANNDDKTTDVKDEHQTVEHVGEPELPVIQSDEHQTVTPVSEPELPAIQSDEHQTVVHVSEPGPTVIQSDEHQTVAQVGEPGPTVIQSTCVHTTEEPAQLSAGEPCKSERTEPQPPPETLVKICDLPKYVQEKRLTDSLREQYKSFPAEPAAACTTGVLAANKPKNRFKNIIAYDHSRVVLEKLEDDPNSDYINANYIDGYKKPKAYIATQGPKKETSHDFWRMVWQEKSRTILMATNVVELGKVKCYKYWPKMSAGETFYGGLSVINLHEDTYPDSVVRTFRLKKNDGGEVRKVKHFHFTAWPDKTVPMYPSAVLTFLSRVKSFNPPNSGPIIVNCSAGVGRTGTFITIDSMLEMAEAEGQVDIYNFVKNSRKDRTYFVQVFDQYDFIHTAILISTVCGITETTKNGFKSKIEVLKMKDANTGLTGFQQEYKNLEIVCPIPTEKQMKAAVSDENVKKNRYKDSSTLPLDFYRPRLMTRIDDEQSTDYINASFVTCYSRKDAFLATQMPLSNTIVDFWRMVYDYRCFNIVMLNEIDTDDMKQGQYWSDDSASIHGPFIIDVTSTVKHDNYIQRTFSLTNSKKVGVEPRVIGHFQVINWSQDSDVPIAKGVLAEVMQQVENSQHQYGNGPIVVQCRNGSGRSGIFCALMATCARMKAEQIIDVFQAVKTVRDNRTGMVESVDQYIRCYEEVLSYVECIDEED